MTGKVKCTCGWSWNKSDSSKKDMYICHECGRDNSNNMKNGGWLDQYADGGTMQEHQENYNNSETSVPEGYEGEGYSMKGRNYSPAWGGQFQMGGTMPGAVGNMYARTGSPSEGKYAKKTLPSAKNGLDSNTLPPPKSIGKPKDVRKKGDVMKLQSMYNTDEVNYVPTVESLKGLKNPNLSSIESAATDQFVDWYSNPETLKRTKTAGYDPARIKDFIAKGLKTPIKVNDRSSDFPMNPSGEGEYRSPYVSKQMDDPTHPDTGYIMYNPQATDIETKSVIGHELPHAAGLDNLYAPSLYRALDLKLPEKYHGGLQYMDRPEEVYGNFQEMRLQMGLKPEQTIDYKTLYDKMKDDKIPNNFWRNFSTDPKTGKPDPNRIKKIVKAINTVAQVDNTQQDSNIQTAQNGGWLDNYDEAQNGKNVKFDAKKFAADKKRNTPLQKSIDKEAQSEDYRRWVDTKEYKDEVKANKIAEAKAKVINDKATIQDRKDRIKNSVAAQKKSFTKDNWRQQLADETQATGDKFRLFPEDPDSFIDEWMNPGVMIGNMASDLGSAPLRAQQEDSYMPYVTSIGLPLALGATEAFIPKLLKSKKSAAANTNILPPKQILVDEQYFQPTDIRNAINDVKVTTLSSNTELNLLREAIDSNELWKYSGINPKEELIRLSNAAKTEADIAYVKGLERQYEKGLGNQWSDLSRRQADPVFLTGQSIEDLEKGIKLMPEGQQWSSMTEYKTAPDKGSHLGYIGDEAYYIHDPKFKLPGNRFDRDAMMKDFQMDAGDSFNRTYSNHNWKPNINDIPMNKDGGVIRDDRGQWDHPGEITEIGSNEITMQGVPYPVLGISDTGDTQMMYPEEEYEFDGEKVTEYPIAQNGFDVNAFQKVLDEKFPRFWRNKKDINIRETNPVKKDNTNINQKVISAGKKTSTALQKKDAHDKANPKVVVFAEAPYSNDYKYNMEDKDLPENFKKIVENFQRYSDSTTAAYNKIRNINDERLKESDSAENLYRQTKSPKDSLAFIKSRQKFEESWEKLRDKYVGPWRNKREKEIDKFYDNKNNPEVRARKNAFIEEANNVKEFYKRTNPRVNVDVVPMYEQQKLLQNKLASLSPYDKAVIFGHSGDKLAGLPNDTIAKYVNQCSAEDFYIGSCSFEDYTSPYKKAIKNKTIHYRPNDPWLGFNSNAKTFDEGMWSRAYINSVYPEIVPLKKGYTHTNVKLQDGGCTECSKKAKNGLRQEQKGLQNLDNLLNFTNYNKPQPGGWLNKYN